MVDPRPNILYIFTDHQNASALSCAGNRDLQTPCLDGLAAGGTRFSHAYCTHPLCTPSRVSMLTGNMASRMGVWGNDAQWPQPVAQESLGRLFRQAGYRCGWAGKWHAGWGISLPDTEKQDFGFQRVCGFDDRILAARCREFLRTPSDQPFLLVASFDNPHNICEAGRDQLLPWGEIPPAPMGDYPNLPANFRPTVFEPQAITIRREGIMSQLMATPYSLDRWRKYRYDYFRLVERVDRQIGEILDALDEIGIAENTIVVAASDHGEMNGAHELGHKQVLYEESVGVPFMVRDPRSRRAGETDDALVSAGLDLLPTLCDYAGIPAPRDISGISLRARINDRNAPLSRNFVASETIVVGNPHATEARMIRTREFKYVAYSRGSLREQLHHMPSDPGEMVNLAVESRYEDVLREHRKILAAWCIQQRDAFGVHYALPKCAAIPGLGFVPLDA